MASKKNQVISRKATKAPVVEAPVVEAPVVEAPVVEAPVVEAPVVEAEETTTDEKGKHFTIALAYFKGEIDYTEYEKRGSIGKNGKKIAHGLPAMGRYIKGLAHGYLMEKTDKQTEIAKKIIEGNSVNYAKISKKEAVKQEIKQHENKILELQNKRKASVKKMVARGDSSVEIADLLDLSVEEVEAIIAE
jgi:hypothetical protein